MPSEQAPGINVAPIGKSGVIGVPLIKMFVPEFVCTLVYHVSKIIPLLLSGRENFTPVDVCTRDQNGSVPLAINGVSGTTGKIEFPVDCIEFPLSSMMIGFGDCIGMYVQPETIPRNRHIMIDILSFIIFMVIENIKDYRLFIISLYIIK